MNREEATLLGFEIVAYAGEARSYLLDALKAAEKVIMIKPKHYVKKQIPAS